MPDRITEILEEVGLPPSQLELELTEDPEDKAIVTAIINLASSLGMHTIAKGVETAGQLAFLRLQGCDEVQGYYFSKPLAPADLETYLREHSGLGS